MIMRAIKIDVTKKEVYEIQIDGSIQSMHAALECETFDMVRLSRTEILWVDDEGLLKKNPVGAFKIDTYPQLLSGHGLIIGIDPGGYNVETKISVEDIKDRIAFKDVDQLPKAALHFFSIPDPGAIDSDMETDKDFDPFPG